MYCKNKWKEVHLNRWPARGERRLSVKLQQLPTTQRTLLYMRQVERKSHEEIATLLGIETTSVSTLLARARRTLLEEIKRRNQI